MGDHSVLTTTHNSMSHQPIHFSLFTYSDGVPDFVSILPSLRSITFSRQIPRFSQEKKMICFQKLTDNRILLLTEQREFPLSRHRYYKKAQCPLFKRKAQKNSKWPSKNLIFTCEFKRCVWIGKIEENPAPISVLGCPLKEVVLQKATPNWRKKKKETRTIN